MTLNNEPDLSFIKSDIKLNEVAPLNRRRVVAFVNCFLMRMTDYLNDFAVRSENAIMEAERQLEMADIKLQILETKLSMLQNGDEGQSTHVPQPESIATIPSVDPIPLHKQHIVQDTASTSNSDSPISRPSSIPTTVVQPSVMMDSYNSNDSSLVPPESFIPLVVSTSSNDNVLQIKDDPMYSNYFKMLKVGIPEQAVRIKMRSEGLDPQLLDTPNAPSPNMAAVPVLSTPLSSSVLPAADGLSTREEDEQVGWDGRDDAKSSSSESVASFSDSD